MTEFISTKFFLMLREASQKGTAVNGKTLKKEYENFATLVLTKGTTAGNWLNYRMALVYTRVELKSLAAASGKKCSLLPRKSN